MAMAPTVSLGKRYVDCAAGYVDCVGRLNRRLRSGCSNSMGEEESIVARATTYLLFSRLFPPRLLPPRLLPPRLLPPRLLPPRLHLPH